MKRIAPLAVLLALVPAASAVAAPGAPDRSFGKAGWVTLSHPFLEFKPTDVAYRDRRIVVGATANVPGSTAGPGFSFFRLLPDGRRDRRFGRGGRADADLRGAHVGALLPDGGFAAARLTPRAFVSPSIDVVRLLRSGARDASFGDGGLATVPVAYPGLFELEGQPDGGLLVVVDERGEPGGQVTVLRLDPSGRLDPSFGSGGRVRAGGAGILAGADLAVRPDGRFVVATVARDDVAFAPYRLTLTAFDAAGRADPTFGTGGVVSEPDAPPWPDAVAAGPGDRLGVVGHSTALGGDFTAWRYEPDGRRSVFATLETATPTEHGEAVAFDRAGRMLLAGYTGPFSVRTGFAVARLGRAGRLDRGFGRGGHFRRPLRARGGMAAIAAQPDGRVLVAVHGRQAMRLLRLDG